MKPIREWSVLAQVFWALVLFFFGIPIALVVVAMGLANVNGMTVALAAILVPAAMFYSGWDKRRRARRSEYQ